MWNLPGAGTEPVFLALAGGFLSMDHQESPSACLSEGFAQNLSRQAPSTSRRRFKLVIPGSQCFDIRCVSVAPTVFALEDALEEGDPVGWSPSVSECGNICNLSAMVYCFWFNILLE